MTKPLGLVEKRQKGGAAERRVSAYRAVTLGSERQDWAVLDRQGDVVFRGDAKVAAMIASRLTRSAA
jgi:hypothetical protein